MVGTSDSNAARSRCACSGYKDAAAAAAAAACCAAACP